MSSNQEFEILINTDGTVTLEGKNFTGAECKQLSKELEADLGVEEKTIRKPEYSLTQTRTVARKAVR